MMQPLRHPDGGLIDRGRELAFHFDGRPYRGHPGDTLASALLANGVHLIGRSFKYHRPRGLLSAGAEEPNGLVELNSAARREPNTPATTTELFDHLEAYSQNRWPSLAFDLQAIGGAFAPLLSAGFYYKTFLGSAPTWTRLYEPLIRRAAGLGRAPVLPDPDHYDSCHAHCDVLVVGSGLSGLMAAKVGAEAGANVVVCTEDFVWGGSAQAEAVEISGAPVRNWIADTIRGLHSAPDTRLLSRTTVFGWYDGNTFAAVERVADHLAELPLDEPRQRFWTIVAKHAVIATGAHERPLVFAGNDLPGTMLASAARAYAHRWAVRAGDRAVLLGVDDSLEQTADALARVGGTVQCMVDLRRGRPTLRALGGRRLQAVEIDGERIDCDLLCMGGGWSPAVHLVSQRGAKPVWREDLASFVPPELKTESYTVCGRAAGLIHPQRRLDSGMAAGVRALRQLGRKSLPVPAPGAVGAEFGMGAKVWRLPGHGKAFVDFQNDVTAGDVELAAREGYSSVELLKRYTTLGMGTDQGKTSNVNGLWLLSDALRLPIAEVGTTTFRPPYTPVSLGALAGEFVGRNWRPTRRTPLHGWAERNGGTFIESGLWLRAQCYPKPGERIAAAANREALGVRRGLGMCDVSTLGKTMLEGPDAQQFLNRVYANRFDKMSVGRTRYALLLREDGIVMDDGTVTRLTEDRFFLTTTTAGAVHVFEHLTYYAEAIWPELDIQLADVTEEFGAVSIAGPEARTLVTRLIDALDLSNDAFPFLSAAQTTASGTPVLLLRVSFSGELGYELYIPSGQAERLVDTLMEAGEDLGLTPYGLEALGILRIEKGFVAGSEINGTTAPAQLDLDRLVARAKPEFVGKAMLNRAGLVDPEYRPQVTGLTAADPMQAIMAGAHLFEPGAERVPANDLGYVTAATWSPTLERHIALAFLVRGSSRLGQEIVAWSPVHGTETRAEVCRPAFYDPESQRARG